MANKQCPKHKTDLLTVHGYKGAQCVKCLADGHLRGWGGRTKKDDTKAAPKTPAKIKDVKVKKEIDQKLKKLIAAVEKKCAKGGIVEEKPLIEHGKGEEKEIVVSVSDGITKGEHVPIMQTVEELINENKRLQEQLIREISKQHVCNCTKKEIKSSKRQFGLLIELEMKVLRIDEVTT